MIPFELVSANSILLQNRPYGLFILLLQPHFTMRPYYFKSESFRRVLTGNAVGANIQNLSQSRLSNVILAIPSIEKQNRIADILSAYDNLIENNQKQIKLLEEAAQRLYKEWFVDLRFPGYETTPIVDGLPEGWKKKKLIDIADIQYGYAFDGSLFSTDKSGTPIVRIRNIPIKSSCG